MMDSPERHRQWLLLPGRQLAARLQLEARKQEDANHAAGMFSVRGYGFANAEDRLAMTAGTEDRCRVAETGRGCCRLLENIEDADAIMRIVAMHQAQEAAFRRAQPMQHGAPLAEPDDAAR